jgi:hypothetical protein
MPGRRAWVIPSDRDPIATTVNQQTTGCAQSTSSIKPRNELQLKASNAKSKTQHITTQTVHVSETIVPSSEM